jgi:hypothetical protein
MPTPKKSVRMFALIWALMATGVANLYAGPLPVTLGLKVHYDASDLNNGGNPAEGDAVTTWRDLTGNALDATTGGLNAPLVALAPPVYHTNVLNGHGGVDFSGSSADGLASAFSDLLNFTNATILLVANRSDSAVHVSVSGPTLSQEFILYDQGIYHHSAPYHWARLNHSSPPPPADFYIQAGMFGTQSNQLMDYLNGMPSTNTVEYSVDFGQQPGVADYVPTSR